MLKQKEQWLNQRLNPFQHREIHHILKVFFLESPKQFPVEEVEVGAIEWV